MMIRTRIAAILVLALAVGVLPSFASTVEAAHPVTFRVTIMNTTDPEQILSPGAWLLHDEPGAFWARDGMASLAIERIAEIGNPAEAVSTLGAGEIGAAPASGSTVVFEVTAEPGDLLSTANMLVSTNDGFVGLQSVALFDGETPLSQTLELRAYEAGTEENTGIGTGFDGGQPDPSRGVENVDNGTATEEETTMLDRMRRGHATTLKQVGKLIEHGVQLMAGSDCGWGVYPFGRFDLELAAMVDAGLTPAGAIASATGGNAKALGIDDTVGTVAPGKEADLLIVDGNPDEQISDVTRVLAVLKAGRVVVNNAA